MHLTNYGHQKNVYLPLNTFELAAHESALVLTHLFRCCFEHMCRSVHVLCVYGSKEYAVYCVYTCVYLYIPL